jgi:hypothetical protein
MVKVSDELKKHGNEDLCSRYVDLFRKLDDVGLKAATLFFDELALHFEKDKIAVLVGARERNIGAAKIFARKLIRSNKKLDLSSIEDAFEIAEEIDRMSIEDVVKYYR